MADKSCILNNSCPDCSEILAQDEINVSPGNMVSRILQEKVKPCKAEVSHAHFLSVESEKGISLPICLP